MESDRFDQFTQILTGLRTRRAVIGVLGGALGVSAPTGSDLEAKKKKKKKKKKTHRCMTYGNVNVSCPKGSICCDPYLSSAGGCAPSGHPVCCASTGYAYESDVVCCASPTDGSEGVCDQAYPHCCPPSIGGCCEAGFPVCCSNALGEYCCEAGTTCCETSPTGCCESAADATTPEAATETRGAWLPAVRGDLQRATYSQRN